VFAIDVPFDCASGKRRRFAQGANVQMKGASRAKSKDAYVEMSRQSFWVYLLKCADDSYYVGMTNNLELRIAQHQTGVDPKSYTHSRRPVELVWSQAFQSHDDAFRCERQIKGWSRAKKEALIRGDWYGIHEIVKQERKQRKAKSRSKEAP